MDENLKKILKNKLRGAQDYSHIQRLLNYAKLINNVHKGNWKIIEAAIHLHELTKGDLPSIKEYLPYFSADEISEVTYCIAHHYDFVDKPSTLEGKIVQDSDILDMLGAIGIARGFIVSGERGFILKEAIDEYKRKRLFAITQLNLSESKKLAVEKAKFTKLFFKTIEEEMDANNPRSG